MALCGISQELFKLGPRNFTHLLRISGLTNMPEMTSLAASGQLQNVIKYCTELCKAPDKELNDSITV